MFRSFLELRTVDPGFDSDDLVTFSLPMKRPRVDDADMWQSWNELLDAVRAVPGLDAVAAASNVPFESPNWAPWVGLPGDPPDLVREGIAGYLVTPGFFDTAGITLLRGRGFSSQDGPDTADVAIVNEAFLREHVASTTDPIGLRLSMRDDEDQQTELTVVGVVGDVVQTRAEEGFRPAVYVPHTLSSWPTAKVLVRSRRDPETLLPELRQAAARFSPYVPVLGMSVMRDRIRTLHNEPRFRTALLGSFAAVAVLLAAIGLYGTLAHTVGRRTRELGIRMALGADQRRIFGLVMRQGMLVSAAGLGIGVVGAALLTRLIESFLFEIEALDFPTFAGTVVLLGAVAATAVLSPARKATRVDVAETLQAE